MPVGCRWVWWRVAAALSAGAGLASCCNALGSVVLCCNVPHLCCNVLYYALCAGVRLGRRPFGAQFARRVSDSARRPQRHAIHRIQTQAQPLRTSEARSSPYPLQSRRHHRHAHRDNAISPASSAAQHSSTRERLARLFIALSASRWLRADSTRPTVPASILQLSADVCPAIACALSCV
jgi:hypothetical protein